MNSSKKSDDRQWERDLFANMGKVQYPMAPEQPQEVESKTQLGQDSEQGLWPDHLIPRTRADYLAVAGLTEPLEAEMEFQLPKQFQLPIKRKAKATPAAESNSSKRPASKK
jgi:hypothetical protein